MITVMATLKTKEGSEAGFEKIMSELVKKVQETEEGTLEYVLTQSVKEPCKFMVYEVYKDQAALEAHSSTDHFKAFLKKSAGYLGEKPVIEICRQVAKLQR